MPIITISRDSYSHGREIAAKVAAKLGYECIGPEIIQRACDSMGVPFAKVQKALHDAPSFLEHIASNKERYLAMYRAIFFQYMSRDNIVYHGLAGHVFLADVPNVVKVRVIADFEERIREEMRREGLSYEDARKRLVREDKERAKWSGQVFGEDSHDPRLYDLYLNLHGIGVDAAVAIIVGAAQVSTNGHVPMMQQKLRDRALAAQTEARLLELFPEVEAVARDGEVFVTVQGSLLQEERIAEKARNLLRGIEGLETVHIGVAPSLYVHF